MTKIYVSGGQGFIGSHIADALKDRGDTLCNETDIRKLKDLEVIFDDEKPEKVIHLAALTGVRRSVKDPEAYFNTNVLGTINMLKLSAKYGVKKFVFSSSSSVYGNRIIGPFKETDKLAPISPYGLGKKICEDVCWYYTRDMPVVVLRLFSVYGIRGRKNMAPYIFTKAIKNGKPIKKFGSGVSKRDWTHISDIVNGILLALDNDKLGFEIINLGSGNPITLNKLIGTIELHSGKEAIEKIKGQEDIDKIIKTLRAKKAIIEECPPQEGDVNLTYADITKAKELLG